MTILKMATNATPAMAAILPRTVTPLDIAANSSCALLSVAKEQLCNVGANGVERMANIANASMPFVQSDTSLMPAMQYDAVLGRDTMYFQSDRTRRMNMPGAVNYTGAWGMFAVFKLEAIDSAQMLLGVDAAANSGRANIAHQNNGTFRARSGDGFAQAETNIPVGQWAAAIAGYNGDDTIRLQVLGQDSVTGAVTVEATSTELSLGGPVAGGLGFRGHIDMAGFFNVNPFSGLQTDLLADINTMIRQFYGPILGA